MIQIREGMTQAEKDVWWREHAGEMVELFHESGDPREKVWADAVAEFDQAHGVKA